MTGPAAWTGAEMGERDDWIVWLCEADRGELDAPWRATLHLPIEAIGPREFALPTLGAKLLALRDEIIGGRGFVLLRGLDIEALDLLDVLAEDSEFHLDMEFAAGESQFLHNHTVFHDRTAFVDWPEPERKRHLLRLWLCPPERPTLAGTLRAVRGKHHHRRQGRDRLSGNEAARSADPGTGAPAEVANVGASTAPDAACRLTEDRGATVRRRLMRPAHTARIPSLTPRFEGRDSVN